MEKPNDIPMTHWILCNIFALNFAQQNGWYDGVKNYKDVKPESYGYEVYKQGLNIAAVTYRFWTKNLGINK